MGALTNATVLRKDPDFASWVETAIAYTARIVIAEAPTVNDHAVRLRLARDAAVSPTMVLPLMVSTVATDPDVATKGPTPAQVGEQTVLDKVGAAWTTIAKLLFPEGV